MSGTIPQLGDPFSAAASQDTAPGFLGQSPAFWQHLAMLGGNMVQAANARTPSGHLANGTGFAGPFGAAIGQTAQQAQGQALNQAGVGLRNAEARRTNLESQLLQGLMPAQLLEAQLRTQALQDPNLMASLGYGAPAYGGGGQSSSAPAPSAQPGSYVNTVNNRLEGGPGQNPNSTASGYGQLIDPMKMKFVAARPDLFQGVTTPEQLEARFQDKDVGAAATTWLAQSNASDLSKAGIEPNGPNLAIAHRLGSPAAIGVIKAPDDMPLTSALVQTIGLPQARQFIDANRDMAPQTVGGFKRQFAGTPDMQTGVPSGGPGDAYLQQSEALMKRAQEVDYARNRSQYTHVPIGPGMADDPAALRTAAQQYREQGLRLNSAGPLKQAEADVELNMAGPIQAQKSANSNLDMREGGMIRLVNPDGTTNWIKNPKLEKYETPEGVTQYGHISPALPGSAPGTPGQMEPVLGPDNKPVMEALPKNVQEQRDKAYNEFVGKEGDAYIAAQNTHSWLQQMNHAADTLNAGGGFLGTGPHAPERLAFAASINDILQRAGLPNAFDANKIGSWEELKKATTTAGFELSSHYEGHARQAAATIENATSAVPAVTNSPVGFKTVLAGIQESAQSAIDLHEYKQSVMNDPEKFVNAGVDFYKANPPERYADRAISTVTPFKVNTPIGMNRYLPGTYVTLPNGKLTQVPERPGAPPIPTYLQQVSPGGG